MLIKSNVIHTMNQGIIDILVFNAFITFWISIASRLSHLGSIVFLIINEGQNLIIRGIENLATNEAADTSKLEGVALYPVETHGANSEI